MKNLLCIFLFVLIINCNTSDIPIFKYSLTKIIMFFSREQMDGQEEMSLIQYRYRILQPFGFSVIAELGLLKMDDIIIQ